MMRLLEIKPEKRITAKEALEHEYLNFGKKSMNLDESTQDNISPTWKTLNNIFTLFFKK